MPVLSLCHSAEGSALRAVHRRIEVRHILETAKE
jgi:hypothetical protein